MKEQRKTYSTLILAVAGTFIFILFLLFIPDMSSNLINTVPEEPPEINIVSANEALITSVVSVDTENVKTIISALSRPTEYFSETQSVLSHNSGSATYAHRRYTKGKLSRVDLLSSNQSQSMHYLYTDNKVYVWREGSRTYYSALKGDFEADDAQMLMTYEDIINANDDDIVSASLTTHENTPCIYAEIKSPRTGYVERYWVSTTNGLLLHGQTLDKNGSIVFSTTATQTEIKEQPDELFILPDGRKPE